MKRLKKFRMEQCEETEMGDLKCKIPDQDKYIKQPDEDAGTLEVPEQQVKGRPNAFEDIEKV